MLISSTISLNFSIEFSYGYICNIGYIFSQQILICQRCPLYIRYEGRLCHNAQPILVTDATCVFKRTEVDMPRCIVCCYAASFVNQFKCNSFHIGYYIYISNPLSFGTLPLPSLSVYQGLATNFPCLPNFCLH